MVYFLLVCLSVTSLIQQCYTRSGEGSSRYECGRHGRFEYCIEGIPGCVIGCHCHPGYYFDTETKICEPNAKLSEGIRRLYMSDPNRIYPLNTPMMTQNVPTQTTTNSLNEMVEGMSKDNDDLGEWLYNQFFKTIETQVINNTSDDKPLTRRVNNDVPESKTNGDGIKNIRGSRRNMDGSGDTKNVKKKRKAHKLSRSKGKKGKSKVHGLRRKLLRITEDDSLFDSDARSDSDEDSSSSSSKSSSESSNSEDKKDAVKKEDNRDHGHKKVIIFNRRPRPPLPSFIFLPNMESPYYPPIGLPPPPIMPMYPMVPVPPMAPFLPIIGVKENNSGCTTVASDAQPPSGATTVSASESPKNEGSLTPNEPNAPAAPEPPPETPPESPPETPPESPPESPPEPAPDTPPEVPTESPPEEASASPPENVLRMGLRSGPKMRRGKKPRPAPKPAKELFLMRSRDPEPRLTLTAKQLERIKLLSNLQEKLKMKKLLQNGQSNDAYDQIDDMDTVGDIPVIPVHKHQNQKEKNRKLKDVNFKYLSQLIHRAKLNGTETPLPSHISTQILEKLPETRRMYNQEIPLVHYNSADVTPKSSVIKDQNDEYFMNLGRQIASLIRDEDAKLSYMTTETPVEKSIQDSIHSILNENRYTPQSYWERYVRSALPGLKSYLTNLQYNDNNQMNLFSLEDEVKTFVSTAKPLSLQDIEDILTDMQKNGTNMNDTHKPSSEPDVSFNVNLLPKKTNKVDYVYRRMYETPEYIKYNPGTIKAVMINNKKVEPMNNITTHLHPTNLDWNMARAHNLLPMTLAHKPSTKQNIGNLTRHKLPEYKNSNHSSKLTLKYIPKNNQIKSNVTKTSQAEYLKFVKRNPTLMIPNRPLLNKYSAVPSKYLMLPEKPKPTLMNYKSINYFSDSQNNHHYMFESSYPLDIPSFKKSLSKRIETDKPSYFHHEYHHFDYLD